RRSSRAIRPWRMPCADASPSTVAAFSSAVPNTLTKTRAWRRSALVRTSVTVTNPTRGSLRSRFTASPSTSRTASSTRRMRAPPELILYLRLRRLELALHLPCLIHLQDIPLADALEVVEHDAALVAGGDFASVVVETAQRVDRRVGQDGAVAHDPDLRPAAHDAVGDVGAGDDADLGRAERLADLDGADRVLHDLRRQEACHGGSQVVERRVDHRVVADLHALAVGQGRGVAHRAHVEADDDGLRRGGEHDVG